MPRKASTVSQDHVFATDKLGENDYSISSYSCQFFGKCSDHAKLDKLLLVSKSEKMNLSSDVIKKISEILLSIENDTLVKVQLEGACVGCSVNQMTLKSGVEMTIKKYAPQIEQVINIEA